MRNVLKTLVTEVDGQTVTLEFYERPCPRWINPPDGRRGGYMSSTDKDYRKKPRLYVTCEETLLENLMNRTTRPVNAWGKTIRAALKQLELAGKVGWSRKAGCAMCACSPGFIWSDAPAIEGTYTYDVYAKLEGAPVARDDAAAQAEQLGRLSAIGGDPTLPLETLANTVLA